ncbi:glycine oxidase ThiO [Nocardiopsis terrae]|uniref:glycine oxidase n=1 Tax=Nocardiopsis terrae TaxID=372655 RepID=A0ABR9HEN7_9ACTN|nr:glycine oxidase ThiO [Nocardiopsis terrae]MBE1457376.1 glycine oxidase [Nocardiopsis terrae]GHC91973.1 glycine oxidase ThiO [Nocardiopsis terrae]
MPAKGVEHGAVRTFDAPPHETIRPTNTAVVVGGGVIGRVTAWRVAQRGLSVTLVEPDPVTEPSSARAASTVAAGMLTPATEAVFGEEELMEFGVRSAGLYTDFVTELQAASGVDVGHRRTGTLLVAFDRDDLAVLTRLHELHRHLGVPTERLTSRGCRRLEPVLAPGVRGGVLAPEDHSVDPRRLLLALALAGEREGVREVRGHAEEITSPGPGGARLGVRLADGSVLPADQAVLAAGCWGDRVRVPEPVVPPLRPVKGQLLRARVPAGEPPLVNRTVRGLVRGFPVYLVPRDGGEVVVGATQEELGHDTALTVGGLWQVLRDARELVPGVSELEVTETCVGLRPGSPDNEPLLGPTRVPGLHLAAGHFRHGVLLAPATGDAMAEALTRGALPAYARRFAADRFTAGQGPPGPGGADDTFRECAEGTAREQQGEEQWN